MKQKLIQFAVLLFAFAPVFVRAGGDEVLVIYNSRLPESKAVAAHYAKLRDVPDNQIYGFDLTTNEEMSRDEFRDSLQKPLEKKLEADKLWQFGEMIIPATNGQPERIEQRVIKSKIRYAVLCYGVPLKIAPDPDLLEPVPENTKPELLRNEAAVDSELAWLPAWKMSPRLSGPLPNWVYGTTNAALLGPTNGILLVARLDGPTAQIASDLVDKAVAAETNGLWGRAYFDARGLDKTNIYYPGDRWILDAAEICREIGFETVVDDKPATFPADFPMSHIAIYCGWYDGDVDGPFAQSKVEFMPGAFAYHLHSSSAASIRTANQFWVGPLLAKGATCTMGCVYEPYLACTPNVAVFIARLMARGFTFGEAAWVAQPALSWQTTVVGDPLYRPFGKSPPELQAQLTRNHSPLLEWAQLRIVDLHLAHNASLAQAVNYLETVGAKTPSAVLTEKLADLYEAQGKPSSAIDMYQKALKLNPSPQQKIRLRLALGEKLQAQGREIEAFADYKDLLEEAPDYPGKNSIEEKIKALQQKIADANAPDKP
jgi:uncharacterized protein (TIGR03790 family)